MAGQVKAQFVNPFIISAMQTLAQELHQQPRVGRVTATTRYLESSGVSVLIGLSGQVRGVVLFDMDERTAKSVVSIMAGAPIPLFDQVAESAIAELGNMITGRASSELEQRGYRAHISPPSIMTGRGTHLRVPETVRLIVPLELPVGTIRVYLALQGE